MEKTDKVKKEWEDVAKDWGFWVLCFKEMSLYEVMKSEILHILKKLTKKECKGYWH